ncbi:MAG: geranylgeranylglycerol-phosphate geranylgeranyltransferase [Flavobacteriales bacterium]
MVTNFLKLIRFGNLVIIALLMVIIRVFIFDAGLPSLFSMQLDVLHFSLLVLSVVLIAAGGNIINDIYDQETDEINKPHKKIIGTHLSETMGWVLYLSCTITGIAIGYYLAHYFLNDNSFLLFHLISPALLWVYASNLKKTALIGNLVISLLAAFVPLTALTFEYGAMLITYWDIIQMNVLGNPFQYMFDWSFYLALFAFTTTLVRELIKDIEDIEGDEQTQIKTLAVKLGVEKTKTAALILSVSIAILVIFSALKFSLFADHRIAVVVYQTLTVVSLIIFSVVKLRKAESKDDFHFVGNIWKLIMIFGFCTCVILFIFNSFFQVLLFKRKILFQ